MVGDDFRVGDWRSSGDEQWTNHDDNHTSPVRAMPAGAFVSLRRCV